MTKAFALLLLLSTLSTAAMAQTCLDGRVLPAGSKVDVKQICSARQSAFVAAKDQLESLRKQVDMTNNFEQKKWMMLTGFLGNYKVTSAYKAWQLCSDCGPAAQIFFKCQAREQSQVSALTNYRTEFLKYDMTNPKDQKIWQAVAPVLQNSVNQSSAALKMCQSSQ